MLMFAFQLLDTEFSIIMQSSDLGSWVLHILYTFVSTISGNKSTLQPLL